MLMLMLLLNALMMPQHQQDVNACAAAVVLKLEPAYGCDQVTALAAQGAARIHQPSCIKHVMHSPTHTNTTHTQICNHYTDATAMHMLTQQLCKLDTNMECRVLVRR